MVVGDILRKVPLGYLYITVELHRDFPVGQSAVFFFFLCGSGIRRKKKKKNTSQKKKLWVQGFVLCEDELHSQLAITGQ